MTHEWRRTAGGHPRTGWRATRLQPVGQPDHAGLRCLHRCRHLHRARPPRERRRAHGRRLGAGHRRDRRRAGDGGARLRQRPVRALLRSPLRESGAAVERRLAGRSGRERCVPGDASGPRFRAPSSRRRGGRLASSRSAAIPQPPSPVRDRVVPAPCTSRCRSMSSMPPRAMRAGWGPRSSGAARARSRVRSPKKSSAGLRERNDPSS